MYQLAGAMKKRPWERLEELGLHESQFQLLALNRLSGVPRHSLRSLADEIAGDFAYGMRRAELPWRPVLGHHAGRM